MPPTESPKKNFILSYGLDKPAAEILGAAKKAGLTISRAYIDILRKGGAKKGAAKSGAAKPAAAKPAAAKASAAPKRKPGRPKKSASSAAAPAAAARRPGRPRKNAPRPAPVSSAARGSDGAFRSAAAHLVVESGAARARQLLEEVVATIRGSVG